MFLLQALGSNGSGQLGIGHKDDVSVPQTVILPTSLTNTTEPRLRRIVAGGNHTLLLLSSGELLWAGDATAGACGRLARLPHDVSDPATPTPEFRPVDLSPLPSGAKIQLAAATWTASTIVATLTASRGETGVSTRVYSFGAGDKGELGLGSGTLRAPEPTQIPDFPPPGTQVAELASCMGHVVAVLSNGEAWGWGSGRKGQLGEPASAAVYSPRRIEGVGFKAVRAVCGREFTCLFGAPETGEMVVLGSDKWGVRSQAPGSVVGWKDVGAGWGSVFVLKKDGALLSWGRNDHGQLAREDLGRVSSIAVGSEHALVLTEDGDVMAWGWGEHGNCGPIHESHPEKGQRNRIASSKALPTERGAEITMVGAGCATSWVVIEKMT
ncbi:alpha tubulin suppressor [Madurella fahalii]|uniref:Alpha tubulin suppressor n=1 Tax=Madurella fahalii TaxID=1157608 RepID=A0ABQ0GRN5_9PEZI